MTQTYGDIILTFGAVCNVSSSWRSSDHVPRTLLARTGDIIYIRCSVTTHWAYITGQWRSSCLVSTWADNYKQKVLFLSVREKIVGQFSGQKTMVQRDELTGERLIKIVELIMQ